MDKIKSLKFWLGFLAALLAAAVGFLNSSCTAGVSIGKSNRVEQTVTNIADSTSASFSIIPNK